MVFCLMKDLLLRRVSLKDLNKIIKIEKENFRDPWGMFSFLAEFKNPFTIFMVLEFQKEITGYIIVREYEESFHITNISVKREYQRKGFGKKMMDFVIREAIKKNKKEIYLEVRVSNKKAIKFYEKLGFKRRRIIPYYYSDFESAYEYVLEIKREKDQL